MRVRQKVAVRLLVLSILAAPVAQVIDQQAASAHEAENEELTCLTWEFDASQMGPGGHDIPATITVNKVKHELAPFHVEGGKGHVKFEIGDLTKDQGTIQLSAHSTLPGKEPVDLGPLTLNCGEKPVVPTVTAIPTKLVCGVATKSDIILHASDGNQPSNVIQVYLGNGTKLFDARLQPNETQRVPFDIAAGATVHVIATDNGKVILDEHVTNPPLPCNPTPPTIKPEVKVECGAVLVTVNAVGGNIKTFVRVLANGKQFISGDFAPGAGLGLPVEMPNGGTVHLQFFQDGKEIHPAGVPLDLTVKSLASCQTKLPKITYSVVEQCGVAQVTIHGTEGNTTVPVVLATSDGRVTFIDQLVGNEDITKPVSVAYGSEVSLDLRVNGQHQDTVLVHSKDATKCGFLPFTGMDIVRWTLIGTTLVLGGTWLARRKKNVRDDTLAWLK